MAELLFFLQQIAKGNFDVLLKVYKNDYFGAFTKSFDIMREEFDLICCGCNY